MITGGTRGIGFAIATRLLQEGCDVMVCGCSPQSVEYARQVNRLRVIQADLNNSNHIQRLAAAVQGELSGLDLLINNAGIQLETDFMTGAEDEAIRREVTVNLLSPMLLTAHLLPLLLNADGGTVVNVSSGLGYAPSKRVPVYSGVKAGLSAWTTALRGQLRSTPVNVVELIPPLVKTDMTLGRQKNAIEPEAVADALVEGLWRGKNKIVAGKSRLLLPIARFAPRLARRIFNK